MNEIQVVYLNSYKVNQEKIKSRSSGWMNMFWIYRFLLTLNYRHLDKQNGNIYFGFLYVHKSEGIINKMIGKDCVLC